ncbi:neuropilin and tolloid-like protein 1 isoform X2 [Cimex lectularius]|nr:neuropilin and tolloid-like protein 1 isoform X2 [Cimex lectularius]
MSIADFNPRCAMFSAGIPESQTFFSPSFPANYPNNTECVKIIEAPPGHYLELDFRDKFRLEPSEDCKFDYLEIRDGANGYDPLIGTYCGFAYPPKISSVGRFLWLKFKSDGNTEYSGFTAVYKFLRMTGKQIPEAHCEIKMSGIQGYVNRSDADPASVNRTIEYKVPLECMWTIRVKVGWKIQLNFQKFDLKVPNDCDSNYVDIYPENTDMPSQINNFCGSIADTVQSPENVLRVRFFAKPEAINSSFTAIYTAYREKPKGEPVGCEEDEYDCEDATCISDELRCNGVNNCRFRSDEDPAKCQPKETVLSEHMIIILIVFFFILTGMCFAFLFNCLRKLIRDHRIIQEHMRRSREARMNEEDSKIPTVFSKRSDCFVPSDESIVSNFKSSEVETRDSQVQTRESLFETGLPGPREVQQNWFTTFGRGPPSEEDSSASVRATSIETTKSAPDVILTRH